MPKHQNLTIGLFGFGVVGEGIYQVLQQTPSLNATIRKICIRHPEKSRNVDAHLFTTDYDLILEDPQINLVVELIDDANEAFKIVSRALKNRKSVVSANKKMIAEHFEELRRLQLENNVSFLYEAAVCGSIPIIRNLEEYYDNDLLQSVSGIVNGSTNYILTKVNEGLSYQKALHEAQVAGFAESDPRLDVEGFDAANKLTILLAHAYGITTAPDSILRCGIDRINDIDVAYGVEKDYKIKLTAQACKLNSNQVVSFVLPQFISEESQFFNVKNEYNGVVIESKLADKQFLYGKGAGRFPTSSAVISDISALSYGYQYEYKKLGREGRPQLTDDYYLKVFISFNDWSDINKWDFEQLSEFHSTNQRQYLIGTIHAQKLAQSAWFTHPDVSIILMPDAIIEKHSILTNSIKKLSLQLAGL